MFVLHEVLDMPAESEVRQVSVIHVLAEDACLAEGYIKESDTWIQYTLVGTKESFVVCEDFRF